MSTPIKNMIGKKIGALTPIRIEKIQNKIKWLCKCDCGNYCHFTGSALRLSEKMGSFSTCGCATTNYNGAVRTIVGIKTALIEIVSFDKETKLYCCKDKKQKTIWLSDKNARLRLFRSKIYEKNLNNKQLIVSQYGLTSIEEYTKYSIHLHHILIMMKKRCYDKNHQNYKYYGEKNIKICDDWLNNPNSFVDWSLLNGYKIGLQIDRINNAGNYEPNNCRWVTRIENANNTSRNVYIAFNHETKSLAQWCRYYNLDYKKTHRLIKYKNQTLETIIKNI